MNRQLRSPFSFRGYLAPLSRRLYQPENRFSSVSRPFHNVSGAASRRNPGTNPRATLARIFLTTTIGPAGLYCWLDYVGGDGGWWGGGSGKWLRGGEMEGVRRKRTAVREGGREE